MRAATIEPRIKRKTVIGDADSSTVAMSLSILAACHQFSIAHVLLAPAPLLLRLVFGQYLKCGVVLCHDALTDVTDLLKRLPEVGILRSRRPSRHPTGACTESC
jgi:hypothetical protein